MLEVTFVTAEDWQGIYLQGKLEDEGHKVSFKEGFELVCDYINQVESVDNIKFTTYEIDQEWMENEGSLPEYFSAIPCDVIEVSE